MPTIIDSLIVTLGLEDKKFKDGSAQVNKSLKQTGDEAEKTGKKLGGAGKEGAKGFNEAGQSLSKFLAVMAGAALVKKFVSDIVQSNAEVYRFSRNLQQNARDISAWGNAVEITGGDAKAFQGTLTMLSRSQTELQMTGQSSLLPYFSRFNVAMMDINGNARKGTDILMDFADATKGMDRTTRYNTFMAMGIDSGTANAMLEGRASLEALVAKQKEHGALTDQQALKSEQTRRSMTEAAITARAYKNELNDGLSPVVKGLTDLFTRLDEVTQGWSTTIVGTATAIGTLVGSMAGVKAVASFFTGTATAGAAGAEAAAGAGIGSRILGFLGGSAKIGGVGAAALLHSGELNKGEDAELAARRAKGFNTGGATGSWGDSGDRSKGFNTGGATGSWGDSGDRSKFIKAAAAQLGVPESAIDAQLRLETGAGGKSAIGAFNYGNIKAGKKWSGGTSSRNVLEYDESGKPRNETAAFRSYSDPVSAAKDYADTIAKRFPQAVGAGTATQFAQGLKSGGYATDPNYVSKIARIAMMQGSPGASNAAMGASSMSPVSSGGSSQVTTTIGEVKVYTQATDAKGIARDIRGALNIQFPSQANTGAS